MSARSVMHLKRLGCALACLALVSTGSAAVPRSELRLLRSRGPIVSAAAGYAPGEVLVRFHDGVSSEKRDPLAGSGFARADRLAELGVERYLLPEGSSVEEAVTALRSRADVVFAEPNYEVFPAVVPNDQFYAGYQGYPTDLQRWTFGGLPGEPGIGAEAAWDVTTGRPDVAIAIIDSGVSFTPRDLARNIWTNDGEVPGNGVDDDANGFVDDANGWDFIHNDADPRPDLGNNRDDDGVFGPDGNTFHGTFAASCAAARGNDGNGVAGAAWNCRVMPLKVFTDDGSASTFHIAAALRYAADMGADVANLSITTTVDSETLRVGAAYAVARDVVVTAAAGNMNSPTTTYPSGYDGVLSVGASDHAFELPSLIRFWSLGAIGGRAPYSQWGSSAVDVVAPGTVFSATVASVADATSDATLKAGDPIGFAAGGTSFSAPLVAGLAALVVSLDRERNGGARTLSAEQVIDIIESSARDLPDDPRDNPNAGELWDGHGRVDFLAALLAVPPATGSRSVRVTWRPPVAAGASPVDLRVVADSATPGPRLPGAITRRTGPVPPQPAGYRLYRGETLVASLPASRLWFVDAGAPEGELSYRVTAVYGTIESASSTTATTALPTTDGPRLLSPVFGGDKLAIAAAGSGVVAGAMLVVNGTNAYPLVLKGGTKWLVKKTVTGSPSGLTIAQAIPAGVDVTLRVINPNGARSDEVVFRR